jgi:hypothetical protein
MGSRSGFDVVAKRNMCTIIGNRTEVIQPFVSYLTNWVVWYQHALTYITDELIN